MIRRSDFESILEKQTLSLKFWIVLNSVGLVVALVVSFVLLRTSPF